MLVPPALRPGDRLRIVAPSGPFDRALVLRGMAWLAKRYRTEWDRGMFERTGFLAGSDERRRAELCSALEAPDVRAIVAARGGYGLTRIAHLCDFGALYNSPKWIVGFSDITVLHVEAARVGVASLHAHNAAGLGRGDALGRARWVSALESPNERRQFHGLEVWRAGTAKGPLFGGNLTLLFSCAAAGRLRVPDGAVLAIEDVGEAPYRVDRMLSALACGGAFDGVSAVIVGDFTTSTAGRFGIDVRDVLRERLDALRVPILAGVGFGHGPLNEPLPFGLPAEADGSRGTLTICP